MSWLLSSALQFSLHVNASRPLSDYSNSLMKQSVPSTSKRQRYWANTSKPKQKSKQRHHLLHTTPSSQPTHIPKARPPPHQHHAPCKAVATNNTACTTHQVTSKIFRRLLSPQLFIDARSISCTTHPQPLQRRCSLHPVRCNVVQELSQPNQTQFISKYFDGENGTARRRSGGTWE